MKFQEITNILLDLQPNNWDKVILYSQITDDSYEIFFYSQVNNEFISSFDLVKTNVISKTALRKAKSEIYELLLSDWNEKKWFVYTMQITRNGQFSVDYEYNDYSEKTFDYKESWEKKYLN